jgi:radical SAM protein with 4Fe4S-binding SPASM domain
VHVARISRHGRALEHWEALGMAPEEWAATYRELADVQRRYRDRLRLTGVVADYVEGCLAHRESRGCRPGQQMMVDLDGGVYPCIMMGTPEMRLGSLREGPLAACLARVAEVRHRCEQRLSDEAVCGACDWRMVCQGACPGWPLVQEGTLLRTDELCDLRRELFVDAAFAFAQGDGGEAAP